MKINLEINNITQSLIEDAFFIAVAEQTLALADCTFLKDSNIGISLALVSKEEIRTLNNDYRKYDSVTDVLSFAEYESIEEIKNAALVFPENEIFLGELIICYDDIKEYAEKEGMEFEKELATVVSHGILHLLGYDHGEKMFDLQKAAAENLQK